MALFTSKAGFVTGAASGIGRASALAFAAEGAAVVVSDLEASRADGETVVRLIEEKGGTASFVSADVRNADDVENLVAATVSAHGAWISRSTTPGSTRAAAPSTCRSVTSTTSSPPLAVFLAAEHGHSISGQMLPIDGDSKAAQ